jgi:hypothetical protein
MNYLKDKGFGPDDSEMLQQQGYDSESITKFLVEKGHCSAESAALSLKKNVDKDLGFVLPKLTHNLKAMEKTDTTRPIVKPPAVKRKKQQDTALKTATFKKPRPARATPTDKSKGKRSMSFIPETQHDDNTPAAAAPSTLPDELDERARVQQTVQATKKTKTKAASKPHRSKQTAMPVMAPNQKVNTLTSEQAGTCAFYKEYLKAAVHAIAPQDPPQQSFFTWAAGNMTHAAGSLTGIVFRLIIAARGKRKPTLHSTSYIQIPRSTVACA